MSKTSKKAATMADVASAAGVSRALVSLAFRDAYGVNITTKEHILKVAKELGYRHNKIAAQLASKSSNLVGVFLQDLRNDWFAEVFDAIRNELDRAGKEIVLAVGSDDGARDRQALASLIASQVEVIIAAGLTLADKDVAKTVGTTPVVSIARTIPGCDSIVSDNAAGAKIATEHLLALGHKNITFISNPQTDGYHERQEGFVEAMVTAGLEPDVVQGSYSRSRTAEISTILLKREVPPTAIFAHNDQTALGVWDAAHEAGLKPGIDISIVGYDNTRLSRMPETSLTTIDSHGDVLGRLAGEAALNRIALPKSPLVRTSIQPTLVVRDSSHNLF